MGLLNILYDSENFYVAEFSSDTGVELVDKQTARSGYLEGAVAARLRACMARLRSDEQGEDEQSAAHLASWRMARSSPWSVVGYMRPFMSSFMIWMDCR